VPTEDGVHDARAVFGPGVVASVAVSILGSSSVRSPNGVLALIVRPDRVLVRIVWWCVAV